MSHALTAIPPIIFEAIGIAGFALYVLTYALLTFHRMTSQSPAYFVLNMAAATCVLIGLTHSFNLASALIQTFWIIISIAAIVVRLRPKRVARLT